MRPQRRRVVVNEAAPQLDRPLAIAVPFLVGYPLVEPGDGLARQSVDLALQPIAIPAQLSGLAAELRVLLFERVNAAIVPGVEGARGKCQKPDKRAERQGLVQRRAVTDPFKHANQEV